MKIRETDLGNIKKTGIYCITNLVNGKRYVGQAGQENGFKGRFVQHIRKLNKNKHKSQLPHA